MARPYQRRRWELNPLEAALQAAAVPSGSSAQSSSVLARSRTWSSTFARSRANPAHSEDVFLFSAPPRNRTSSGSFEDCHAIRHTRRASCRKCLDQELNLDLDLRRVLCDPLHHRDLQRPDLESNQDQGLRRAPCDPLHHRDRQTRADDWICTSIMRFTGPPPFSVEPRRQAGVRGFEPRWAVLEAASSPRRTLLYRSPALRPGTIGVTTTPAASRSSTLR